MARTTKGVNEVWVAVTLDSENRPDVNEMAEWVWSSDSADSAAQQMVTNGCLSEGDAFAVIKLPVDQIEYYVTTKAVRCKPE